MVILARLIYSLLEAYTEPCQTSKTDLSAKIVYGSEPHLRCVVLQCCEYASNALWETFTNILKFKTFETFPKKQLKQYIFCELFYFLYNMVEVELQTS